MGLMLALRKIKFRIFLPLSRNPDSPTSNKFWTELNVYVSALLLLYDVTNKTSFDNIRAWLGEIREYSQDDVVIMLLGKQFNTPDHGVYLYSLLIEIRYIN